MKNIQKEWQQAASELKFKIEVPFVLTLQSNICIEAEIFIPDFGGKEGILIFTDYDKVKPFKDELWALGFSWSVIGESTHHQEFDIESFIDALSDWEWKGAASERPDWLREPTQYNSTEE